jgi:hypothetical protein
LVDGNQFIPSDEYIIVFDPEPTATIDGVFTVKVVGIVPDVKFVVAA